MGVGLVCGLVGGVAAGATAVVVSGAAFTAGATGAGAASAAGAAGAAGTSSFFVQETAAKKTTDARIIFFIKSLSLRGLKPLMFTSLKIDYPNANIN